LSHPLLRTRRMTRWRRACARVPTRLRRFRGSDWPDKRPSMLYLLLSNRLPRWTAALPLPPEKRTAPAPGATACTSFGQLRERRLIRLICCVRWWLLTLYSSVPCPIRNAVGMKSSGFVRSSCTMSMLMTKRIPGATSYPFDPPSMSKVNTGPIDLLRTIIIATCMQRTKLGLLVFASTHFV